MEEMSLLFSLQNWFIFHFSIFYIYNFYKKDNQNFGELVDNLALSPDTGRNSLIIDHFPVKKKRRNLQLYFDKDLKEMKPWEMKRV